MNQEVQRRWKASIVFGLVEVLFGIILSAVITFCIVWKSGPKAIQDVVGLIPKSLPLFVLLCCCLNPPAFVMTVLGSYYQFKISNDILIDAIWKKKK